MLNYQRVWYAKGQDIWDIDGYRVFSMVFSDVDVILEDGNSTENNSKWSKPKCVLKFPFHLRWMYFPHKSREADKQSPSQPNPMFKGQQFHDFMAIIWWARYLANWSVNFPFSWTGASIHQLPIWVKDDINVDSIWFHEPFVDDFPGENPLWSPGDQSLVMFLQDLFEAT